MSYEYFDQLPPPAKARYQQKLQISSLEQCPYRFPASVWQNDPSDWPEITYLDIWQYLIDSPGIHTKESMKAYKSLSSYKMLKDGWIQTVFSMKPTTEVTVLKAEVTPSYRINEDPHNPWVAVKKNGSVIAAHCDCKAGLGEACSHVGAILFKLEMGVRLGLRERACTDEACRWNDVSWNGVEHLPLAKIQLYNDAAKAKLKKGMVRRTQPQKPSEEDTQGFLLSLLRCKTLPVGLSLHASSAVNFVVKNRAPEPLKLPVCLTEWKGNVPDDPLSAIQTTDEEIQYLESSSREQSESLVWHDMRVGRITASIVHQVLHTKPDSPAPSLMKRIITPDPRQLNTPAVAWGRQNEETAIQMYSAFMCDHAGFEIQKSGLILSSKSPYLGASPDGLVVCNCCGQGLVEVKCSWKCKDSTIAQIAAEKSYLDENLELLTNHQYYDQVQHQLWVTQRSYCDFVVWTTLETHVARILPSPEWRERVPPLLKEFWVRHVIQQLKNFTPEVETESSSAPECHCPCGNPDDGNMIGCDNKDCVNEWYHFECAGIVRAPKKKAWFCDLCKPKRSQKKKVNQF